MRVFRMASTKSIGLMEAGERKEKVVPARRIRKKKKNEQEEGYEFVAPDGGWGWVIAIACGLSNFSTIPLVQNFGLIYKEKYEEWGISQTEYSFMRNLEFTVSSVTGLFSGALLKKYGFRKLALIGALVCVASTSITSQVTSITEFTIFYAVLGGISGGIAWPSLALAINTYFKKRRGIATGLSWTATGLSPVIMPQLITFLMPHYGVHGTVLILAGIALHSIPASLLLQPAHWHGTWVEVKKQDEGKGEPETAEEQQTFLTVGEEHPDPKCKTATLRKCLVEGYEEDGDYIVDTQSTLGLEMTAPISRHSSRWSLGGSEAHRRKASSLTEEPEREEEIPADLLSVELNNTKNTDKKKWVDDEEGRNVSSPKSKWMRALEAIVNFFDLTILKDPKFVIIFVGMTLAFAGEVNFLLFSPFVFAEYGFGNDSVALFMTTLASMDLVTRFTIPFFTDKMNLDPKMCYAFGLTILATGRIVLAHGSRFTTIMVASLLLGLGKGFRTVYMALVIPSYVPLHRLPTASGLQMLANGVIFMTIGPVFGYLRDQSHNYVASLHGINILTFTAITLWTGDSLVNWIKGLNKKKDVEFNLVKC